MDIKSIINKKRERRELTNDEIRDFINAYLKQEITDAQAGVVLNCIYEDGMTEKEIISFACAMADSGKKIELGDIANNAFDKHSTGGVGDKVSIILIPLLASFGIPVVKISSRGMGIAFGTIEKLEAIPGYTTEISAKELRENLNKVGVGILSQTKNINPAENKIYKLRNEISCIDAIPLIAACLMSLKLSTGAKNILFEINYGNGTYIHTKKDANRLSFLLKRIGNKLGRNVICAVYPMDEPLGKSIGNNLEMIESIEALNGKMSVDLEEAVVSMASAVLKMTGKGNNLKENEEVIRNAIKEKLALKKFKEMIEAQGGDTKYIDNPDLFEKAKYIVPVKSNKNGVIRQLNANNIANITRYIGAGRMHNERLIDDTAGIVLHKKVGDEVREGDVLAYLHTDDEDKIKGAGKLLLSAYEISEGKSFFNGKKTNFIS